MVFLSQRTDSAKYSSFNCIIIRQLFRLKQFLPINQVLSGFVIPNSRYAATKSVTMAVSEKAAVAPN